MPDYSHRRTIPVGPAAEIVFARRRFVVHHASNTRWFFAAHNLESVGTQTPDITQWEVDGSDDGRLIQEITGSPLPLIVKFSETLTVAPRSTAELLFPAPLVSRFAIGEKARAVVYDGPCRTLSKTWAGSTTDGEIGLEWKTTPIAGELPQFGAEDEDLALCTMRIANSTPEPLSMPRLSARLAHVPIFRKDGRLWLGIIAAEYHGSLRGTDLDFTNDLPERAKGATPFAPPRTPRSAHLIAWTFQTLAGGVVGL